MKKVLALVLSCVFVLSVCGFAAAEDDITLDVIMSEYGPNTMDWFLGSGTDGTNFVKKFEAENPGIKLNLEVVPWNDINTIVSTRISNNNPPDILNSDIFSNFADEALLLPVDDYCPEELYGDFIPTLLEQSRINGTVWGLPILASVRLMYYNTDIFEEAGVDVPETWDELEDACQAILDFYDGEIYPFGIDLSTDEGQAAFSYFAWGNGGGFVDAEGNWDLNSDANVEAAEFAVNNLVGNGYTNPSPTTQSRENLQDMFAAGKLAMLICPNQLPSYIADKGSSIEYDAAAIPHSENAAPFSAGVMDRFMVFKDDSAPDREARNDAIRKFMSFFFRPENYIPWVAMEGFTPTVRSASDASENAPLFISMLETANFYPTSRPEWDSVKKGVISVLQNAVYGEDVRQMLDQLQESITG